MSTDNHHSQDEIQNSMSLPDQSAGTIEPTSESREVTPPVPQENPSPNSSESTGNPVEPTATPTLEGSTAAETSENVESPKRKIQLRPIQTLSIDRAIPSISSSEPRPLEQAEPAVIPRPDDADVEAEIAQVVAELSSDAVTEAPGDEKKESVPIPDSEAIDASLEAAIEAAMAGGEQLPLSGEEGAAVNDVDTLQQGQKLTGVVQAVNEECVFLDFGLRMSGAVPFRQFQGKKPPEVGQSLEVVFDRIDEAEGLILTNLPRGIAKVQGDWNSVSPDQVVECVVTKTNKGGLEATVSSLRGFIPASHIELGYVADLEPYVGQKLRVKIIEVNPKKRKLVLSRKALLAEEREASKTELMEELKPDQIRTGVVKTIKDYGAFIDLGGTDGFLPIAQMSWVRIEHPSEILSVGQQVEVKILSIDREKDRISLGMRQLAPNPWKTAETKYEKGSTATGRVTRVEPFGAFVELEPGVEGLVHISELDHRRVKRVTEVLNVGDMPEVQILEVDPGKKRISLSVKALKAKPEPVEQPKDEDLAPGKGERYERRRKQPLKGGTGTRERGGLFGNPKDFER